MPIFVFKARTASGKIVNGKLEAKTSNQAVQLLSIKQLEPVSVEQKKTVSGLLETSGLVKTRDVVSFARQMAFLISSGVSVLHSLRMIRETSGSLAFKKVLDVVIMDIEGGSSLADALRTHSTVFNKLFVSMIQSGESGGNLDIMLKNLADYIETSEQIKSRVKKAMWYPGFIILAGTGIMIGIMVGVVPKVTGMFKEMDADLPLLTEMLVLISDFLVKNVLAVFLVIILLPIGFVLYCRSPHGRPFKDQLLMLLPVIGSLCLKSSVAKFSKTLSCLLSSGVDITEALSVASDTADNYFVEKALKRVRKQVTKGKQMAQCMKSEKIIPYLLSNMVSIGEESGNVDATLSKVAEYYEEQVKTTANTISELIQPVLILILGGITGLIVLGIYLPIIKLPGLVGGI